MNGYSYKVEDEMKRIKESIERLMVEVYKLHGALRVYEEFNKNGVIMIDKNQKIEKGKITQGSEIKMDELEFDDDI
jgi:hypothetical protein